MKSTQKFRSTADDIASEDLLKKPAKLEPIKKSGKEKRAIYSTLDDGDEDEEYLMLRKKDSILDYFDDGDEEDDMFEDEEEDYFDDGEDDVFEDEEE